MRRIGTGILTSALSIAAGAQPSSVVNSPHNLSAGGPGPVRAAAENEVCIFCHAPHNASPVRPLWNRAMPPDAYSIYASRALDAEPGQPTGTSKMCLSCHDGTIALGALISRDTPISMAGGVSVMPNGPSRIGTDLRDDHPISFRFTTSLSSRDPHLRNPNSLPEQLRLDANDELQCTTCHDAHNNGFGDFLVMPNSDSQMCKSCHTMGTTTITAHTNCTECHQTHTSPSGPYLLRESTVTGTCLKCHNGTVSGAPNINADLSKPHVHDTDSAVDPPDPQNEHATCTSCHDPHTMGQGSAPAPTIHANFGRIDGVNLSGVPVTAANEFEVCFKCHADSAATAPIVLRQIPQNNTRLEFAPNAVSFHPVTTTGRNGDVPSLLAPWTTASQMHCSDCHASENGTDIGGSGANGTHGSNFRGLLNARYETADFTSESAAAYALCYRCHSRANILDDRSFSLHDKHIRDERTPCSACHDSHGIASAQGNAQNNSHLINFDTTIVQPLNGVLRFRDLGTFRGECTLSCHGEQHNAERYGF